MEDPEEEAAPGPQPGLRALLPSREFLSSRKGRLILGESVLSFVIFICYVASSAVAFMTVPLLEFLLALFYFYVYSSKLNEKFKGIHWPVSDFIRCVTAAIIYFAISIAAVSKYSDGASKAAGLSCWSLTFRCGVMCGYFCVLRVLSKEVEVIGFIATIVYAVDFYLTFNDLTRFLKQGNSPEAPEAQKSESENSDSD